MIRAVLTELREGYRYPDEWNRLCREYGMPADYLELEPRRRDRVARALCWAATEVGEYLATSLEPRRG